MTMTENNLSLHCHPVEKLGPVTQNPNLVFTTLDSGIRRNDIGEIFT